MRVCISEFNYSGREKPSKSFNYIKVYLSDLEASKTSGFCKYKKLEDNGGYSSSQETDINGVYITFQGYIYMQQVTA